MKKEIKNIVKDVENKVKAKETVITDIIKDAPCIISILESGYDKLKSVVSKHGFTDQKEEIFFFKEIKPKLFCKLIYYQNTYHIELQRPITGFAAQKEYFEKELEQINIFYSRNTEFIQYYRSGRTVADSFYFIRGIKEITLNKDSFYFEMDSCFSTAYDFKLTKLLANDMLAAYINNELIKIERKKHSPEKFSEFQSNEKWTDKKVALVELIYAIHSAQSVNSGNIDLKTLAFMFEKVFNIELDDIYHVFLEIRNRKNERTIYLNKLVKVLNERMDEVDA
ncbi:MAG: RteC domain-containing protein [Bacteroidales bacterium]|jgi:hypothetical protein|nr:RteC domain-containing protein [Bacteroidales bacterium]